MSIQADPPVSHGPISVNCKFVYEIDRRSLKLLNGDVANAFIRPGMRRACGISRVHKTPRAIRTRSQAEGVRKCFVRLTIPDSAWRIASLFQAN